MKTPKIEIVSMVIFIVVCIFWTNTLFFGQELWIPLDHANFAIHELGHFVFMPFGEFLMMLGGSLFQILVPLILTIYFISKNAWYSTAFGVFWVGDNIINVGRYIADSRALLLPLFGGGRHDWNWILSELGLLGDDITIAYGFYFVGRLLLIIGIFLMIAAAFYYLQNPNKSKLSYLG